MFFNAFLDWRQKQQPSFGSFTRVLPPLVVINSKQEIYFVDKTSLINGEFGRISFNNDEGKSNANMILEPEPPNGEDIETSFLTLTRFDNAIPITPPNECPYNIYFFITNIFYYLV